MKKYISIIAAIFALVVITSCTDEGMDFDTNGGKGLTFLHFVGSIQTISTELDAVDDHTITISVASTVKSEQARTYTLSIDPSSTAIEGTHYNLSSKTVTIPANQHSGSVTLTVVIENLVKQVLNAVITINSDEAINYGRSMTVAMNRFDLCEFVASTLVGTFNYESDDWDEEGSGLIFEADPDDPYKIYILGYPESEDLTSNGNRIELNIDPEDFTISGPKVIIADNLADWGLPGYTNYAFEPVSGEFDICNGTYTIIFNISTTQANFGGNEFIFSK